MVSLSQHRKGIVTVSLLPFKREYSTTGLKHRNFFFLIVCEYLGVETLKSTTALVGKTAPWPFFPSTVGSRSELRS